MQDQTYPALRKLQDSELSIARRSEDIRGHEIYDRQGNELGTVDALFVDEGEKKVRFLRISSGGFLGLGATKFLVPVDAVRQIEDGKVTIDQTREHVAGAPRYTPELVVERDYYRSLYGYYGYAPFWGAGYTYPPYPYYPPPATRGMI